jgi:PAS domain S-box-containing protein
MNPITALCFLLGAVSLWLRHHARTEDQKTLGRFTAVLSFALVLVALLRLIGYLLGTEFGVDRLLFAARLGENRMAPNTAACFLLVGLASLLPDQGLHRQAHPERRHWLRRASSSAPILLRLGVFAIAYLGLAGYLFGAAWLYHVPNHIPMALNTALCFCLLALGELCARPDREPMATLLSASVGGDSARRLLPMAFAVPLVLGLLRLEGQRRGLYDTDFGVAIQVTTTSIVLAALVWCHVRQENRLDTERRRTESLLAATNADLERRVEQRTVNLEAANRALRESEAGLASQRAFLRQVIDTDPNLIFVKDKDGRFALVNEATAALYGASPDELTGKFDEHAQGEFPVEQVLIIPEEMRTDAQGKRRWFRTVRCPLVLPGNSGEHFVLSVATEITQSKRLEEQLQQAQKMEAVGRLAGGVAHDFNNMLAAISGYTELMLMYENLEPSVKEGLEEVYRAAQRAATLTRQLLAFSRKQVIVPRQLDMGAVVGGIHGMLRRLIGADIELITVSASTPTPILADAGQIEQILINLVVNARDAMPRGGRVTVETQNVTLDATYAAGYTELTPGEYVLLAVSDTGHGMDAETIGHIFEPFFTTKEVGEGTGLGLATVYGIVKQNGGHIAVYSEPGLGTTFKVYFPRHTGKTETEATTSRSASGQSDGQQVLQECKGNILLVEDEPVVRAVAKEILTRLGYTVWEAGNGAEALRIVEQQMTEEPGLSLDMLVTDVVMPQMGGRELMERISAVCPDVPVLFLSGYTDDAVVRHGVLNAEAAFLQKPFTSIALRQKVEELLRSRVSRKAA